MRPGLEALRDLAAEGQIAAALVYSPDRLSRKYAYQVLLSGGAVALRGGIGFSESRQPEPPRRINYWCSFRA